MDPIDVLEDFADRKQAQYTDVTSVLTSLEDTRCNSTSRASVLEAMNHSLLKYAIYFSPEKVESLLEDGEDAAGDLPLHMWWKARGQS